MPNSLAHFGVQGVLTRLAIPSADPKIIFLGCLLPDIPWIEQRLLRILIPSLDPYSLRLYVIVQATLLMTFLLCGALATFSKTPGKIFGVLALSAAFHLLLDALQTKWANGVHFFAPVSWELLNFGLFWPESLPTYVLTGFGLGYVIWTWRYTVQVPLNFPSFSFKRVGACLGLLSLYLVLPFVLLDGPLTQDNHSIQTLMSQDERIGRSVEFDRKLYRKLTDGDVLYSFGEQFQTQGNGLDHSAVVSIRGQFVEPQIIHIKDIHEHTTWFRDGSSYIGLALLFGMWTMTLIRPNREILPMRPKQRP